MRSNHAELAPRHRSARPLIAVAGDTTADSPWQHCVHLVALALQRCQRFWHSGQKNVDRWAWTMRRTVVPQRSQVCPSRP